jgi:hypothetical protein
MIRKIAFASILRALFLVAPLVAILQGADQKRTLTINGQSTQVPVVQLNSRPYVDLEALADAVHGSLSTSGNMVALSVSLGSPSLASSATASSRSIEHVPSNVTFSREFLNAGIEEMSTLREWHTVLATAIQNGIPLSASLLEPYRAQATTNLHLASVAASTTSDRSAYQLLSNAFQNMVKLSDKYVNMRANLTYISPDALKSDNINQRIITCGHWLGAMAASGQFMDNGSCGVI